MAHYPYIHLFVCFVEAFFSLLTFFSIKRICDEFEEMSIVAGERPTETEEVVGLQNYITICREEKVYNLTGDIQKAAERVLFLLHYAVLSGKL